MSKTDKTDSYIIKVRKYGIPYHDHRDGVCDLPPRNEFNGWRHRSLGVCDWRLPEQRGYWMLTEKAFARPKAIRAEAKHQHRCTRARVRAQLQHGDWEAIDNHPTYRRSAWWAVY